MLLRFFNLFGIDPNLALNAKRVKELFGLAAEAAYQDILIFNEALIIKLVIK